MATRLVLAKVGLPNALEAKARVLVVQMDYVERKKQIEAMLFFVQSTKKCGLVKLFKLLYFLDMLHFREVGRPVTGLHYFALPYGPVPTSLYEELNHPAEDLASAFTVQSPPQRGSELEAPQRTVVRPLVPSRFEYLTKREQRIASELADMFRDVDAGMISEISHARNGPWDLARKAGAGKWGRAIDYFDALNLDMGTGTSLSAEHLREREADYKEVRASFP